MTRDVMDKAEVSRRQPRAIMFRRRTTGAAQFKEMLALNEKSFKNKQKSAVCDGDNEDDESEEKEHAIPMSPTLGSPQTRRMSIGGEKTHLEKEKFDWEQPRLDIEGFVADYICHRTAQDGFEWYDSPTLPYGVQPEHEMMRMLGAVFEKKNEMNFEIFAEQLLSCQRVSFSIYQEVVQSLGVTRDEKCAMGYGRMIGLISFTGMVSSRMMEDYNLRSQVRNLFMYTSLFIKARIRSSWREHNKSWKHFMELGETLKRKEELEVEKAKRRNVLFYGAGVMTFFGIVIGGKMLFSSLK